MKNYKNIIQLLLFLLLWSYNYKAQSNKKNCNLKSLSKSFANVKPTNTKVELDELFNTKGELIENKCDTCTSIYKYQFCNDQLPNTIFATFFKNTLVQLQKSFTIEKCYSHNEDEFSFKKNSSYDEIKKIFGVDGELKLISWNYKDLKETQREYTWASCNKIKSYTIVFMDGKAERFIQFPIKPDYSRPSTGKK